MGPKASTAEHVSDEAEEFRTLEQRVSALTTQINEMAGRRGLAAAGSGLPVSVPDLSQVARKMIRLRRKRDEILGDGYFGDPAWDLFLDLFIAAEEGRQITMSSACIAAAVPATTALRWINVMESRGDVRRISDPKDGRRTFIVLTPQAQARVRRVLESTIEGRR